MILISKTESDYFSCLDKIGLKEKVNIDKNVLIKINLAHPAQKGHPRTDIKLLSNVIQYVYLNGGTCAIAESANGYLKKNLEHEGLGDIISKYQVEIIDLDFEEIEQLSINGEKHYIPKCLRNYGVRIAIPATSKRPQMIFSNNVKLFVGAVPRCMYQIDNKVVDWRPRIHIELHKSVANIFSAIQNYSPFSFFINGGLAMDENEGEFMYEETLIGNDGIELDLHVLEKYYGYLETPEYLKRLQKK
ncbi:DUF362 domain-containing protein [Clostridium sp.]|uniref:DUF362 domain-containing protein n=1 Tax=Clostridium sp. TaxID=1506 RepID=UPI002843A9EB|nr:DUF362 domain-containing protein [Clostridium sp.]MDR3598451.1 DUF362 domain-containing protein [Clostridium sp.]